MDRDDRGRGGELCFRPLGPDDLRLLHEWLQRPHVRRWWHDRETYEEVVEHYLPSITGDDPTDLYVVLLDDGAVGFVQTYLVADYPEYAELTGVGDGVAGVDLFIADAELTGRGLGTGLLRRFVEEVVFARAATTACVADPDVGNTASLRAFEKAGFRVVGEVVDPEDAQLHALARRHREACEATRRPGARGRAGRRRARPVRIRAVRRARGRTTARSRARGLRRRRSRASLA